MLPIWWIMRNMDYESLKDMFCFPKVKNMPMKHWFDNLGWDMVEGMHEVVLQPTEKQWSKSLLSFVIFINEVTTFDKELGRDFHPHVCSWKLMTKYSCFVELGEGHYKC